MKFTAKYHAHQMSSNYSIMKEKDAFMHKRKKSHQFKTWCHKPNHTLKQQNYSVT